MKKVALSIALLCLISVVRGGNPVMLIRCNNFGFLHSTTAGMSISAPQAPCFFGALKFELSPFDCNHSNIINQKLSLTISRADGTSFGETEIIPLTSILNCIILDVDDTDPVKENIIMNELELINSSTEKSVDSLAYKPLESPVGSGNYNQITIDFTRNPFLPTRLKFSYNSMTGQERIFEIPACPMATDPCSCRPENITDANGNVLYWADEIQYSGTANENIVITNNNLQGFLDNSQNHITTGTVFGPTSSSGALIIPFFKAHGETTNIILTEQGTGNTTNLNESCPLAADACIEKIPTLGEWALIILSLLLLTVATVAHRFIRVATR